MKKKKYYWIKLQTNFYEDNEAVDFLMSQKDGSNYIVLYQMLCLKTANRNGNLSYQVGEMIIPYDIEKIVRDCKYFSKDTVVIALGLYKQLGLIYIEQDGTLQIADFDKMVGSEGESAERVRLFRERRSQQALQCNENVTNDVTQEIRDKSLDLREKNLDINIKENHSLCECQKKSVPDGTASKRFVKPTIEEIAEYCTQRGNNVDAQKFFDYYESNGWKVGRNSMKDWKAAVRSWERNGYDKQATKPVAQSKLKYDTSKYNQLGDEEN